MLLRLDGAADLARRLSTMAQGNGRGGDARHLLPGGRGRGCARRVAAASGHARLGRGAARLRLLGRGLRRGALALRLRLSLRALSRGLVASW